VIVNVADAFPFGGGVMLAGEKLHDAPEGWFEHDNATALLNPPED